MGRSLSITLALTLLGTTGCAVDSSEVDEAAGSVGQSTPATTQSWNEVRASRQAALDKYLADNAEDYRWFKNATVGSSGIPMIMFRLFPELFPEIWGTQSEYFASAGFAKDTLEPSRVLPIGLGYTKMKPPAETPIGPVDLNVVQLTCTGCHGGRVVGPSGSIVHIIGAPSTTFTSFRANLAQMVTSTGYTATRFRLALLTKLPGWVYNDPAMLAQETLERSVFLAPGGAEEFLDTLKAKVLAGGARFDATLGAHTYDVANAPDPLGRKPGYLDALGAGMAKVVDPARYTQAQLDAILPPAPAEIDIMSVWRQADRPTAQWDGSIESPLHRNLGAEFGVIGDPALVNMENGIRTTRFTENLPATPYPFAVDMTRAERGRLLYDRYCASCHAPGNDNMFGPDDVGTDPNRANVFTQTTATLLAQAIRLSCTDPVACRNPDGSEVTDDQIALATGAYMSLPLDGIWARAPYLHNGSVPTLYALLTGDRPTTFYRGNQTYDQAKVGFTWDKPAKWGGVYDTRLSGLSNTGHDTKRFNGIDWKSRPADLSDLLEYLKTL
jgi:hypothetical protein